MQSADVPNEPADPIVELFAGEIPEIASGQVRIHALSRARGVRTKVAVDSSDPDLDPIAACVGHRGTRLRRVAEALGGDRIDVILWSPLPEVMIRRALAPLLVDSVTLDPILHRAFVLLKPIPSAATRGTGPEHRELASKLSGWDITIIEPPAA